MRLVALRRALSPFKPILEPIAACEAALFARLARMAHFHLFAVQWGLSPAPEHFDHAIDRYYLWEHWRNSQWVERGVYSNLVLQGKRVLELCCGDGFNAKYFYSLKSESVMACDFDPKAIRTAKRKNAVSNVEFRLADIRHQMPEGKFENIIWDAAIEHFTVEETATILSNIRDRLTSSGILSGHTIVERSTREKQLFVHHEFEFKSKEDLLRILSPYFKNVFVFETIYPERHNLYFYASDDSLPFSEEWTRACLKTNGNADFGVVRK